MKKPPTSNGAALSSQRPEGQAFAYRSSTTEDLSKLAVFEKNFYMEHPHVTAMTDQECVNVRKAHDMTCIGDNIPKPVRTFEEASFPVYVLDEIKKLGFEKPTGIQMQGWPMALSGRDMIGIAATGSGKTLAFILPGIVHINAQVSDPSLLSCSSCHDNVLVRWVCWVC